QKFQRRQGIAARMIATCKASGDRDGLHFWSYAMQALDCLTYLGMSDEEDGYDEDNTEPLKYVFVLPFRHTDFQPLFQYVDNIPDVYPDFFPQAGRKRMKRVGTQIMVTRPAPPDIPPPLLDSNHRVHESEVAIPGPSRRVTEE
ncbi:hypothetical protein F5878DRAFT_549413, partial [Lentinula raphanica]